MNALARVVWAMMRAPVLFLLVLYAVCGLGVAGSSSQVALLRVLLVLVPFLAYSALINDLADARIDAVNLPGDARRVVASGAAHRRQLGVVLVASLAATVAAAASLGATALLVTVGGVLVSTAYSIGPARLADRGIVASLTLPACYVAVPFLLGLLAGRGSARLSDLPLLGALYVGFIARIVLKDFRDVRGDALFGKRTFLVRHGRVPTCRVSAACWAVATVLVLAVTPQRTVAMAMTTVVGAGLALWLLRRLAMDPGHRAEERIISALAILGRGTVVVICTPLMAAAAGTPTLVTELLVLGVGAVTGGLAVDMHRHGPSRGVAAVGLEASAEVGARHT